MNKSILIKSGIVLVVLAVIHSVFWFFKTGQIEKQVNNFISENSSYISAGEISVSGFPLNQTVSIKDLKFSSPNSALGKHQITVKHLLATAGIFNNSFTISIAEQASVQDNDSNLNGLVEFSKDPEITATISDGMISKFSYLDFGHRVLDAEKNVIYASSETNISFESMLEEGDKIKTKITANIKDIEGFDILSIYKNSSEKKVIEGIKTGEITIGNSAVPSSIEVSSTPESVPAAVTPNPTVTAAAAVAPAPTATPVDSAATKPEDMAAAVSNNLVKSNFSIDAEYTLTPTQSSADQQTQTDPTQIQETPLQYSKMLKINNLEFSNPLYKININGQIDTFQDDTFPSGSVSFRIEKIDNLINHITAGLNQIAEKSTAVPATVQSSDLNATNTVPAAAPTPATTSSDAASTAVPSAPAADDSYQAFLKRFTAGLPSVAKEVSVKNPLSKDDLSVFDIRREKNLDFLINETPTREILGKF